MARAIKGLAILALLVGSGVFVACSSDDNASNPTPTNDGGTGGGKDGGPGGDDGGNGTAFTPPADPGPGGFWVTVSGEDLASVGYDWTSSSLADGDPPGFVDGWAVTFEHVIVTVDKIRVNADPDKDEGNPQDVGAVVASADGPFAVDATIGGSVVGKSGSPDEKTVPIAAL